MPKRSQTELKGIGLSKAKAIVEYRKKHGPFKNADELSLVKGIGERTVEMNRADIRVKPPAKPNIAPGEAQTVRLRLDLVHLQLSSQICHA